MTAYGDDHPLCNPSSRWQLEGFSYAAKKHLRDGVDAFSNFRQWKHPYVTTITAITQVCGYATTMSKQQYSRYELNRKLLKLEHVDMFNHAK